MDYRGEARTRAQTGVVHDCPIARLSRGRETCARDVLARAKRMVE